MTLQELSAWRRYSRALRRAGMTPEDLWESTAHAVAVCAQCQMVLMGYGILRRGQVYCAPCWHIVCDSPQDPQ